MSRRTAILAGATSLAFLFGLFGIAGLLGTTGLLGTAGLAGAAEPDAAVEAEATAAMVNQAGDSVGTVALKQGPHGTHLHARLTGLPPGTRAIHVHEVGTCDPPDFQSAGGHYDPDNRAHGFFNPDGYHAGDLPNIHVPESGMLEVEFFNERLKVDDVFDDDGTSVVIHTEPDDYRTDPAGQAGTRIACGVIERN
jgi:superoxide dismutase, Cu-Zn family